MLRAALNYMYHPKVALLVFDHTKKTLKIGENEKESQQIANSILQGTRLAEIPEYRRNTGISSKMIKYEFIKEKKA